MSDYWLGDDEGKIIGPIGLEVLLDLALNDRLPKVSRVSRDGSHFSPLADYPEVARAFSPKTAADLAENDQAAVHRVRAWLAAARAVSTPDLFRLPASAPLRSFRAAFFGVIRRFYPDRLPDAASAELRLACEEAFLFLAERMVEVEKSFARAAQVQQAATPPLLTWRQKVLHVQLSLSRSNLDPLLEHPELNVTNDSLYIRSSESVPAGTPVEVRLVLDGVPSELFCLGKAAKLSRAYAGIEIPQGFGVHLTLSDSVRDFLQSWLDSAQTL